MASNLIPILLILLEEVLCESFWWSPFSSLIGPGFGKAREAKFHKRGLPKIRDAWNGSCFLSSSEAEDSFGLVLEESGVWDVAIRLLHNSWGTLVSSSSPPPLAE